MADSKTWLGLLAREKFLVWALALRKFRISGNPKLFLAFGKCFPSRSVWRKHVEVVPEGLLIQPFDKNDQMIGRIRWQGDLLPAELDDATRNVKTFRFVNPKGGEISFRHVAGQFLTRDILPDGIPTKRSFTFASPPKTGVTGSRSRSGARIRGWCPAGCMTR